MRCDILTLFPPAVEPYLAVGVLGRGIAAGVLDVRVHDLRKWAVNRYGQVDDEPYGGGPGMVLMASAVVPAVRAWPRPRRPPRTSSFRTPRAPLRRRGRARARVVPGACCSCAGATRGSTSAPRAPRRRRDLARRLRALRRGAAPRWRCWTPPRATCPGWSATRARWRPTRSPRGLLDHPVYTRPRDFEGLGVPDVLASGDHEAIRRWRLRQAVRLTLRRRPDLLASGGRSSRRRSAAWRRRVAEEENLPGRPSAGPGPGLLPVGPADVYNPRSAPRPYRAWSGREVYDGSTRARKGAVARQHPGLRPG